MIVPVPLAGLELPWAFRGSRSFDRWMADPVGSGETRVGSIQTTGPRAQRLVDQQFYWMARLMCLRDGRCQFIQVDSNEPRAQIRKLLSAKLGTAGDVAAGAHTGQSLLVHTSVSSESECAQWAATTEWLEYEGKRYGTAIRAVASDVPKYRVALSTEFDFRTGWPNVGILESEAAGKQQLWNAYLHARFAWDAGGHLDRAQSIAESRVIPRTGDDDGVEVLLQRWSVAEFRRLTSDAKQRAVGRLDRDDNGATRTFEDGTWWLPHIGLSARPTPWCARALLDGRRAGRFSELLRSAIVCQPLATEILQGCIDGERLLRGFATLRGLVSSKPPGADAERLHSQFVSSKLRSVIYPSAHPARPDTASDAWVFARLGEFIGTASLSADSRRNAELLRELRNAVAHGHYVCWRHVEQLLTLHGLVC